MTYDVPITDKLTPRAESGLTQVVNMINEESQRIPVRKEGVFMGLPAYVPDFPEFKRPYNQVEMLEKERIYHDSIIRMIYAVETRRGTAEGAVLLFLTPMDQVLVVEDTLLEVIE